jgi:hypothetical protein
MAIAEDRAARAMPVQAMGFEALAAERQRVGAIRDAAEAELSAAADAARALLSNA